MTGYDPILDTPREEYYDPSYDKPGYDALSDDEKSALYWKDRERAKAWDKAVRHAISTGAMTPEEAHARGYRLTGHESGDNSWAEFNSGWRPLPQELYHVTTDTPSVLRHGLKTRQELGQQRGLGLGAGDDETISFTTDRELAGHIREALRQGVRVAQGHFTPAQMIDEARRGAYAPRPFLQDLWSYWNHEGEDPPPGVQDLLEGKRRHSNYAEAHTAEEWAQQGMTPDERSGSWMGGDNQMRYNRPHRPMTEEEQREANFDFYKTWLAYREHAGGPPNPLFMSTDVPGLANVNPEHINVLGVQGRPGAMGYPLGGMNEWRVPTGDAVDVTHVNGQPIQTTSAVVKLAQPLYKRWVFSPASGKVTLADNTGGPRDVRYHTDLARELNEPNLVHGYAYRIPDGWRLTDWDSKPVSDNFVVAQVMRALQADKAASGPQDASWDPSDDEDWSRMHQGIPG